MAWDWSVMNIKGDQLEMGALHLNNEGNSGLSSTLQIVKPICIESS